MYLYNLAGRNYELLSRIIQCESGFRADAKNPVSSASGLAQFLKSTWQSWGDGDVFNPYDNIRAMVKLFKAQGTKPWLSSQSCWLNER